MDIKDFMPLVRIIALEIRRPLPSSVLLDDLVQDGMIGLVMAFREYNADLGVPFRAFAGNKIRWAIMDGLRAGDWAGKTVRRHANKVTKEIERLQALLHRQPSKKEVADALGVRVDDVAAILGEAYGIDFVQIDEAVEDRPREIPDSRMEPAAVVEQRNTYSRAIAGLKTLQPGERRVFILRSMCDFNGRQVAAELGLSESRVSQLFKSARDKLGNYVLH